MSRLIRLESENVKKLKAVTFIPKKRGASVVRGRNEAGKTSLVESIDYLFAGARAAPPEVIRLGETHAKVVGETDDFIATRKWWRTESGIETELEVVSKVDGKKLGSPQKILDKVYEQASDPTAFFTMKKAERLDWLKKLVGVDTTLLEKRIETAVTSRHDAKKLLAASEAQLKGMPADKPPPKVDTAALLQERGSLTNSQQWERQAKSERDGALRRIADAQEHVRTCEQALKQAQARLDAATKQAAEADNAADDAEEKASGAAARLAELDELLQRASAIAAGHARWEERERLAAAVKRQADDVDAKEADVARLRDEREKLIAAAKFPLPGLGFGTDDVTFNGLPLEQASAAQRIKIGASLIISRNPKMRLMRVPEGAFLDEENLAALDEMCTEADFQCIVEIPGENGPATLVIRNGEAVEP